jgi:hypothetical protein
VADRRDHRDDRVRGQHHRRLTIGESPLPTMRASLRPTCV